MLGLVEIGPLVLDKILKRCNFLKTISQLSLGKGVALYLNKIESPSPKNDILPSLIKIDPVVVEKKMCQKFTDRQRYKQKT